MTAGVDLLLTLIRDATPPERPTPKALGIDDWAWRKGQTYGTILVDLEEGVIVELLPDRNAETVAQWLREHPGVEIITRDRSTIYADGATQGAPNAVQIADRWHLLQNATAVLLKVFQRHQNEIELLLKETQVVTISGGEPTQAAEQKSPLPAVPPLAPHQEACRLRRQEQVEEAQQLRRQGWTMRAIAAHLDVTPKTIRRYLNLPLPVPPQRRTRRHKIASFKPYLLQRWNEGCHNATQLFREIQAQGYSGQATMVRLYVAQLRQSSGHLSRKRNSSGIVLAHDPTIRLPTMRTLSWHIARRPNTLSADQAAWVDAARNAHPHVQIAIELVQRFARLIRRQPTTDTFDSWLENVMTCPLIALRNFGKGLRNDYSAVKAAMETGWNNGPTEGHVNRLKLMKRQMFGRAHFDLLRQRLLAA